MSAGLPVGWHADRVDPALASIRYRMLAPLRTLAARGMAIERFDPARAHGALIFCKSQSAEALALARALNAAGRPVLYDLCDNLFVAQAAGHAGAARVERVRAMLALATIVTVSTAALAAQLGAVLPDLAERLRVVPDVIDADEPLPPASAGEARSLAGLDRFLAQYPGALHAVWFGNSIGRLAGRAHLGRAVSELERFDGRATLTLLCADPWRARVAALRWRLPVHAMRWRLATARAALARHRVAVIPVERNAYTEGKTLNRPATALLAGLGVVADPIPSYAELAPFIALDDWPGGLAAAEAWPAEEQARVAAGAAYLAERYGPSPVADRWAAVIEEALD